jgi:hypothetical protein
MDEGTPDRRKGFIVGIAGGLIGAYVMRRYVSDVIPRLFPDVDDPARSRTDALERRAPFGPLYEPHESAYDAGGRIAYTLVTGTPPQTPETRRLLGDLARWGAGLFLGVMYGATRTSTLPRDIAGGFFYGIRIWLGDEILLPLLGLRAGPSRFTRRQHFALLTAYWVYSFVTTNTTRLLYRLFSPHDR